MLHEVILILRAFPLQRVAIEAHEVEQTAPPEYGRSFGRVRLAYWEPQCVYTEELFALYDAVSDLVEWRCPSRHCARRGGEEV